MLTIAAGICHVLGLLLTYRAFEIGTLSLVSPIASGFAVVTAALALISGSEQPPVLALGGSALLIGGTVLATRSPTTTTVTLAGVPEAIGSALAFGTMFWMIDVYVTPSLGFIWPLVVLKLLAVTSSLLSFAARPSPMALHAATPGSDTMMFQPQAILPARATSYGWLLGSWALGAAATDMLAWIGWTLGSRTEYATVVTALASLFSVVTILLA